MFQLKLPRRFVNATFTQKHVLLSGTKSFADDIPFFQCDLKRRIIHCFIIAETEKISAVLRPEIISGAEYTDPGLFGYGEP